MNQNELQNNTTEINDLTVTDAEQVEIKGGPKRIFIGGLSAKETATTLLDLEPQGEVKGGVPAVQKIREHGGRGGRF